MSLISGAHAVIFSSDPVADRVFFRDVLELPNVDVGNGWLIFGLPPSELAVHPTESSGRHELYLMVENVTAFVDKMMDRGVRCDEVTDEGWGLLTSVSLPGGGTVGVYQPRHERPDPPT